MAKIYEFPNINERDWREMEIALREGYKDIPDGLATLEECLPMIRGHWQEIFESFSVQPSYLIPEPITKEQSAAIDSMVANVVQLVADRLKSERHKLFGLLVACEYKAAYFRRNRQT